MSTAPHIPLPDRPEEPSPPSGPALIRRERWALHEVLRLVRERAAAEAEVHGRRASNDATADRESERSRQELLEKNASRREHDRKADEDRRRAIVDAAFGGENEAKGTFAKASRKIAADFESLRERAKQEHNRARSTAAVTFDAGEKEALAQHAEAVRPLDRAARITEAMKARLAAVHEDSRKFGVADPPTTPSRSTSRSERPADEILDRLTKAEPSLALLEALYLPRALKGNRSLWIFVILFLLLIVPAVMLGSPVAGSLGALSATVALGILLRKQLMALAWKQVTELYYPLFQTMVDVEALTASCRAAAAEDLKAKRARVLKRRDDDLQAAKERFAKTLSDGETLRDDRLRNINEVYAQRVVEIQTHREKEMRAAVDAYERRKVEVAENHEASLRRFDEKYQALKEKIRSHYETTWAELASRWLGGMGRVVAELAEVGREVDAIGPRWDDPAWDDRPPPRAVPPVVRLGEVPLDLGSLPQGVSSDPRLREGVPDRLTFPALLPFPERANLLIEAPAAGRKAASAALQATMLRLLTSLPPGLVKFTIIDPVGIGREFGAFMHLADYDESLVNGQVWTEGRQIEERLADLSAHMERVTQRYLRNEYATIEEYNAVAGEVAEPYRVVIVADFPAGFDDKAAARLASLAVSGPPCGVLTMVALDLDRPLPSGFNADDLRAPSSRLTWDGTRLTSDDPDFARYPLALDPPPPAELATRLIHRAGAAARDARRVEVPFEFIAPPPESWWTRDSRTGIDVPLGKAGATKRQHLTLGQGTSQHVLLAGRTGSGKSTLLHALITNIALNYSPDEVDLYLIDFKKGVEFKVYATYELPHASVVAIESEREFGISVLQRLDVAMRERADLFRDAGVQDIQGYRNTPGTPPLPRLLLIVDEFQEFFVEEDRLAQEAALLLDRLVRQGRAFGVHVHLGSQSLGGAYALARTTLGQMAVRIALQCSDADSHMILSESNPAARLLSRPGEAVYNDANGLAEGNHFFQVVWLGDDRREAYLKQLSALARERKPVLARTPLVFEGDAETELARNPLLAARLDGPAWPSSPRSAHAWLGDPVAIKDPTSALFRRQGGNHLLIVGQNDEAALGVVAAALVSLAVQFPPSRSDTVRSGARFAVLDGTPEDHPHAEFLGRLARRLPHPVAEGGWRDSARILADVAAEVERRQQPDADDGPEIFLFIHDLPRFRDLRKRENDFGFGRRDEEAGPADHLAAILREGSGLGVHLITWCDNLNNLNRYFDHQALREFEMRVLFQMSPNDSGHLLDSPQASKLGPHRAFFSSEEQNRLEKFRPYGIPSESWLDQVAEQLRRPGAPVGG